MTFRDRAGNVPSAHATNDQPSLTASGTMISGAVHNEKRAGTKKRRNKSRRSKKSATGEHSHPLSSPPPAAAAAQPSSMLAGHPTETQKRLRLQTVIDDVKKKSDLHDARFQVLESNLEGLEKKVEVLTKNTEALDSRMRGLEERVTRLEMNEKASWDIYGILDLLDILRGAAFQRDPRHELPHVVDYERERGGRCASRGAVHLRWGANALAGRVEQVF